MDSERLVETNVQEISDVSNDLLRSAVSSQQGTDDIICAPLIGMRYEIHIYINGRLTVILYDTGAQVSILTEAYLEEHYPPGTLQIRPVVELLGYELLLKGVGQPISYTGYVILTV